MSTHGANRNALVFTVGVAWVFAQTLTACNAGPAGQSPDDALALNGRELLARYHCGRCHVIPGVAGAQGQWAASLHSYGRRSYIAGRMANEPVALARWIADPAALVPGTLMPNMGVSPEDARAMALYLGRLR